MPPRRSNIKTDTVKLFWIIYICFVCICIFSIYIYARALENIPRKEPIPYKLILYWNNVKQNVMNFGLGSKIFENCQFKNCYISNNTSFTNVEDFDAIIFHHPSFDLKYDGIPGRRRRDQKYILYRLVFDSDYEN